MRGRAGLAGLLVAMAVGGMAPAALAQGDATATAAGSVTVSGSEAGRVRLVVPADATLDVIDGVTLQGDSGWAGYLLTRPGFQPDDFFAYAISTPGPEQGAPLRVQQGSLAAEDREEGSTTNCTDCPVPAGTYDLYLLTDGDPVSVTLTLGGLDGAATVTDLTPNAVQITGAQTENGITLTALPFAFYGQTAQAPSLTSSVPVALLGVQTLVLHTSGTAIAHARYCLLQGVQSQADAAAACPVSAQDYNQRQYLYGVPRDGGEFQTAMINGRTSRRLEPGEYTLAGTGRVDGTLAEPEIVVSGQYLAVSL